MAAVRPAAFYAPRKRPQQQPVRAADLAVVGAQLPVKLNRVPDAEAFHQPARHGYGQRVRRAAQAHYLYFAKIQRFAVGLMLRRKRLYKPAPHKQSVFIPRVAHIHSP